jgi:hypothetical protein
MNHAEETATVCFLPTGKETPDAWGAGVICRLPSGTRARPSRLYWNQPAPRPYEIWLVRPCCDAPEYVKPLRRLAAAPFPNTMPGRVANHLLYRLARTLAWLHGLSSALRRKRVDPVAVLTAGRRATHS